MAITKVTFLVVLWSWLHSGRMSSVTAAVHASTWLSAVDIVAAKMEAKMSPAQKGPSTSMARVGSPSSASKPSCVNTTRLAHPMTNMRAMNGVCQTKNHTIACLRSLSDPSVITRETTCGCPATPSPPRKKAKTHRLTPSAKLGGTSPVSIGFSVASLVCRPPNPPTWPSATQQSMTVPMIITHDCAASVQIEARMPPA